MNEKGGGVWILLLSVVTICTLFEYNASTILSPIVGSKLQPELNFDL